MFDDVGGHDPHGGIYDLFDPLQIQASDGATAEAPLHQEAAAYFCGTPCPWSTAVTLHGGDATSALLPSVVPPSLRRPDERSRQAVTLRRSANASR